MLLVRFHIPGWGSVINLVNLTMFGKVRKALHEGGIWLVFKRPLDRFRWSFVHKDYKGGLTHVLKEILTTEAVYRPVQSSPMDVGIAKRVLKALEKAEQDEPRVITGDIWDRVRREHDDFYSISNDPVKVAAYLNDFNRKNIAQGISCSPLSSYEDLTKNPTLRREWAALIQDDLICLAEAVGAVPYNLEGESIHMDTNVLLKRVEEKMGMRIVPSGIEGGLYTLEIGGRYFSNREFYSVYYGWRTHMLGGNKIAEIGAGMGKAAWYALQLGVKDYSIFDLPLVNLLQAWFLIKSGVEVVLYGEQGEGVKILPYWEYAKDSYDLTLNTNSFSEMDASIVTGYLETAKKNSKYLLSINQEGELPYGDGRKHVVVARIADKVGLKRLYRFPSWFPARDYLVEELYTV